ncbi:unnamed protein product, partial [Mycena citricolor]
MASRCRQRMALPRQRMNRRRHLGSTKGRRALFRSRKNRRRFSARLSCLWVKATKMLTAKVRCMWRNPSQVRRRPGKLGRCYHCKLLPAIESTCSRSKSWV